MPDTQRPNVIFVLTDDQGYADLGCTGNPWIQTPNIDGFYQDCVRFPDFHVQPLCTPTRGALMSGHRPIRNGAWATCWGRSILRRSEVTVANVFADNGYATGMFGKWHLGDNYPYRPQDRGFQHVVAHKGGGVGQTPDFWGNNYFDDTYFENGVPRACEGYCTDVWFHEGLKFIEANRDRPFLAYIATNAPHSPYLVAERYRKLYDGNPDIPNPPFYGMITNIDENFGKLDAKLAEWGLQQNTILIFMTDNGSSGGADLDKGGYCTQGYNAGMRGKKGSYYDGGHRVPFFIRWPAAGIEGGRDLDEMVLDVDFLPTLIELCGLQPPDGVQFDGMSAAGLLRGTQAALAERVHFLQIRQSTDPPQRDRNCTMTRDWRLVFGRELYDIKADPEQRHDVASQHPDVVARLQAAHNTWWDEVMPWFDKVCPISLGNAAENPTTLDAMDVMGDVAWNQRHILAAQKSTGQWTVDVEKTGKYRFSLRRWPPERDLGICDVVPDAEAQDIAPYGRGDAVVTAISPVAVRLSLFDTEVRAPVEPDAHETVLTVELDQTGVTKLDAWFVDEDGKERGAYYVTVEWLG